MSNLWGACANALFFSGRSASPSLMLPAITAPMSSKNNSQWKSYAKTIAILSII
ncbi:MAG: hypothetical protein QMC38_09345 [Sinobacterium sp.]